MTDSDLKKAWLSLGSNAKEPEIAYQLVMPKILKTLGFGSQEICQEYLTGWGSKAVDIAARKNSEESDIFAHTKQGASLIVELKSRSVDLNPCNQPYQKAVQQLKDYLSCDSSNCSSVKWGILTNADSIQLFRRHGRVVYPYTTYMKLNEENIDEKILLIKKYIDNEERALCVSLYNNKGGVGKTTTAINLAGILSLPMPIGFGKRVLVIDFDPNQKDLSDLLDLEPGKVQLSKYLKLHQKQRHIADVIVKYRQKAKNGRQYGFDVMPSDPAFLDASGSPVKHLKKGLLRKFLTPLKKVYDYILIDTPPGHNYFTIESLAATDVVLMPSKHNGLASFKNAAEAITTIFTSIGEYRREYCPELESPTALPIFFNGEQITPTQKQQAKDALKNIIEKTKKDKKIDLSPIFFPKDKPEQSDDNILELPHYAHIASSAFLSRPAVFTSQKSRDIYRYLVEEYFI